MSSGGFYREKVSRRRLKPASGEKGVRRLLCAAPSGPFRQKVPDPFFACLIPRQGDKKTGRQGDTLGKDLGQSIT